jgi:malonyl-CoA decarboxylase
MKSYWFERFLERIADRGRELMQRRESARKRDMAELCDALLGGRGEASGTALSRELLRAYDAMDRGQRLDFFRLLARAYDPRPEAVRAAAEEYLRTGTPSALARLTRAVEAPRQELFRRINRAPHGTAALVAMRAELLEFLQEDPSLKPVDADLKHLLASWFNRGFLRLQRIDWRSPAEVLEKLIRYDMVQAVKGWDDLRRRVAPDRRCFAFFHPGLPDEPLIFVEIALVQGMADAAYPLFRPDAPVLDPEQADTAMFISLNSTQKGLRGLSFGNLLLKQVLEELQQELPNLRTFATLSPVPGFAETLRAAAAGAGGDFDRERLEALLADFSEPLRGAAGGGEPVDALLALLDHIEHAPREVLAPVLERLTLAYLGLVGRGPGYNPVANFHLSAGARLERINPFADMSPARLAESFGVMVNYRYVPDDVVENHEAFVGEGRVTMSAPLKRALQRIEPHWVRAAELA